MIQNHLDLLLAAEQTALENLTTVNEREIARNIATDFDELKIDDTFFAEYDRVVRDRSATFANLKSQALVVPATAKTTAAPAK